MNSRGTINKPYTNDNNILKYVQSVLSRIIASTLSMWRLVKGLRTSSKMLIQLLGTWSIPKCHSSCRKKIAGPKRETTLQFTSKLTYKNMIWHHWVNLTWYTVILLGRNMRKKQRNLVTINKTANTTKVILQLR